MQNTPCPDIRRSGVTVLHGDAQSVVDIVLLHGLNGSPSTTWRHSSTGYFWPWELRHHIPDSRIMLFGYDADIAPQLGTNLIRIKGIAESFLSSLVNKRQEEHEVNRPLILVGHSLGGLVLKKALVLASQTLNTEADDAHLIYNSTKGLVFLGTPHIGSGVGRQKQIWMLKKIAKAAFTQVPPKLESALELHSDELADLADDFRRISLWTERKLGIYTYFETYAHAKVGELVVDETSARIGYDKETAQPIQANHEEMVRYEDDEDSNFENLYQKIKILRRKAISLAVHDSIPQVPLFRNKYYEVPQNVSSAFTGREDICRQLSESCFPTDTTRMQTQKRYVIYGLGGSGKTQVCLKFAEDHREKFWGIFWINTSTIDNAERGFLNVAQACRIQADLNATKRWLSNTEQPWLLILDNADDPNFDLSQYFPVGNRGTILITSRNPGCRVYATVGSSELSRMETEEAITLLLKLTCVQALYDPNSREMAKTVVLALGCLALAIVQAGAVIGKGLLRMEEYCWVYSQRRKELLSTKVVQDNEQYKYTVYTTWEISLEKIKDISSNAANLAMELLHIFSFLHYEGIPEEIFHETWKALRSEHHSAWMRTHQLGVLLQTEPPYWDPIPIRRSLSLLSSFSLISRGDNLISMHPLVHAWARDRLGPFEQERFWTLTASTMATSISSTFQISDYQFRRSLVPHIDACLEFYEYGIFHLRGIGKDCLNMAEKFSLAYSENGRRQEALQLRERVVAMNKRTLGEAHLDTLRSMHVLAISYSEVGRKQEALQLREWVVDMYKRTLGEAHLDTLKSMHNLAYSYSEVGRRQEALQLIERVVDMKKRTLGEAHPDTLLSVNLKYHLER